MFKEKSEKYFNYTVKIRRQIHENPELSGREEKTVGLICKELGEIGIDYVNVNKGGVLAFIEGKKELDNPKTILLRADIDALALDEPDTNLETQRQCTSKKPGLMHACGHDGHTAMLLTVGKILNEERENFAGRVILCFERGEERGKNYPYLMAYIDQEAIDIDGSYAIHVDPAYESGVMAIKAGNVNAAGMFFDVTIKGEAGHGSRPYMANNPLDCFVELYESLKNYRMTKLSPFEPFSYSVGAVDMGTSYNQIPERLRFKGSARFFDRDIGYKFHHDFRALILNKVMANKCRVVFHTFTKPHFPIINDEAMAELAMGVMADELGEDFVAEASPSMGSDSFSVYTAQWPGIYLMLGIANKGKGTGAALHSEKFDLDEDALKNGVAATCRFVVEFLNSKIEIEDGPFKNNLAGLFKEEDRTMSEIEEIYASIKN